MTSAYTYARRGVATAQNERVLSQELRHRDSHFDARPVPDAGLRDLRVGQFLNEYLPATVDAETLAANDRTTEERLAGAKMIASADNPVPTVAGILALGRRPQDHLPGAYAQFLRLGGTESDDEVLDEARCTGPITHQIRRLDDKLVAHNRTSVDFKSGDRETRISTYPLLALQQLVRNAIMHRNYEGTNAPVHVYWFDDRVEITNPGSPFGDVNSDNFGQPGVVDYRNPTLAEAMRVLGLVQHYGFGIPAARQALCKNGQAPPEFGVEANRVHCTVWARRQ